MASTEKPRRLRRAFHSPIWVVVSVLLLAGTLTGGLVSRHNLGVSAMWRTRAAGYQSEAAGLTTQLTDANTKIGQAQQRIGSLESQTASLTSQVSGLQTQLATVANDKAKAQDQAAVLARLLGAAGAVANALNACVNSSFQLTQAVIDEAASGIFVDLTALIDSVNSQCHAAQSANGQLQLALTSQ